jgi:coproporphyrinogen III oxidase
MSLPPVANWHYDYHPKADSEEEATLRYLSSTQNWIAI